MGVLCTQVALGKGLTRKAVVLLTPVVKNMPQGVVVAHEQSGSHAGESWPLQRVPSPCGPVNTILPRNMCLHLENRKLSVP